MTDSISQQTSTLNKQVNLQAEINNKLNDIKKMAETLSEVKTRIYKLEHHNEYLVVQVNTLCEEYHQLNAAMKSLTESREISSPKTPSDVIFSGIRQSLSCNSSTAITKVLKSIDASHQAGDILDIRFVNKKHEDTGYYVTQATQNLIQSNLQILTNSRTCHQKKKKKKKTTQNAYQQTSF